MATKNKQKRLIAIVHWSERPSEILRTGRVLVEKMTGNPDFPSPNPPLGTLGARLDALDAAETGVKTRALGMAEVRNARLMEAVSAMHTEVAYVQSTADADPTRAETIITGAGLAIRRAGARTKGAFEVFRGATSGTARLVAKAIGRRVAYEWQMSADSKNWNSLQSTVVATTTVRGLTPATIVAFRMRTITRDGASDWSQVVELLVV